MVDSPSIAIVGAGAIGSYYGARLALAGCDVKFLMRSELAAVRERGLTLRYIAVTRGAPAVLEGFHTPGKMTLSEFSRPAGERVHALVALFQTAGVDCRLLENLAEARWRKLIWNIPFNGLAIARGGITTNKILGNPAIAAEVRPLMNEVADAGRALGFEVPEKFIQAQIDITPPLGAYAPSSLVDFLAGREVEVDSIWGEPLRRAQAAGLAMPRLAALHAQLLAVTKR